MKRAWRVLFGVLLAALLLYGADRVSLALRKTPVRSVEVETMLEVPQKSGRVEYIPGGTETRTCVQSLFPHLGSPPCWYLERHRRRAVHY
jgi:hypothetical protein